MKEIKTNPMAQGDILIIPVSKMPNGVKKVKATGKHFVVAHSETGHHHVVPVSQATMFALPADEFTAYITTKNKPVELKHEREFDTHESIMLEPMMTYEVRRQRQFQPDPSPSRQVRRVID